jgi:predicted DNA-binding transcriptional regulator AlpA
MSSVDSISDPQFAAVARSRNVVLSPYVNERFPAWEDLLSAHDVSRLTRRPRWVLLSLMVIGRFPRKVRFRGHAIGWLRPDIAPWLVMHAPRPPCLQVPAKAHRPGTIRQVSLPFEAVEPCAAHKARLKCSLRGNHRP